MLTDLRETPPGKVFEADVCIIGAGAAGITLARALRGSGLSVLLLESGGTDFDAATQDFNAGPNLGMTYYDLVEARLRFFGGTTAIWGGRCAPLDPIDFEPRPWVPLSGWPLDRAALEPWYRSAHDALGLGSFAYDDAVWRQLRLAPPPFDADTLRADFWRFDLQRDRFTLDRCGDLASADDIEVLLHATCTGLVAAPSATAVTAARLATPEGREASVRARCFVAACGGIENPRLLLASRDVEPHGIGNGRDLVGRYFMEHPHGRAGRVVARDPYRLWKLFRRTRADDGTKVALTWRVGEPRQRRDGLLNASFTLKLQREPGATLSLNKRLFHLGAKLVDPHRAGRRLLYAYKAGRGLAAALVRPPIEWWRTRTGQRQIYLIVRAEQAPNADSRVTLAEERDRLGMPRAALAWRLGELDKQSVAGSVAALDEELRRLGLGRVEPAPWLTDGQPEWPVDLTISNHHIGGFHHMGTTRMGTDPATSVVDPDGRVHGYDNLYVAGSSVFPTGGWANPTLTILALALRLGERLRTRYARRSGAT